MIGTIALVIAVVTTCGGIVKYSYEYYSNRNREAPIQTINNYIQPEANSNLETIVIEELKRQGHASPREIEIKINVHKPLVDDKLLIDIKESND